MIIQSKKVFVASQFVPLQIEIEEGKIKGIYEYDKFPVDEDYGNLRIVPGFYDVHTHGYFGYDTNHQDKEGLKKWLQEIPREGVCGITPTTITQSFEVLSKALENVASVKKENPKGAEIIGIHFEGPYLDEVYKGAQPLKHIKAPNVEQFKQYLKASDNLIKIITMAPEHDENFELVKFCRANGIAVSIGHSSATYNQTLLAVANGANGFTHTYNGMTGFNHRENGIVGAAFRFHDTFAEVICDGFHSTPTALNIFFREKKDYAIMVTDSLMCKGFEVGSRFEFGGQMIEIYPDKTAHLVEGSKGLSGSTLSANVGLKILVEDALVPFEDALASLTRNPAKYLGLDDHKGYIKTGYDADIVVLEDNYDVKQTFCKGIKQL